MEYTFITGATGGIGKAFAEYYAAKGCNLYVTGRSDEKLINLKTRLLEINPNISVVYRSADLTNEQSRNGLFEYADDLGLYITRLVNVAGADIQKAFINYTEEKVLFQIRVNVEATIALTHAFIKRLSFSEPSLTFNNDIKSKNGQGLDANGSPKHDQNVNNTAKNPLPEIITVSSLSGVSPMPYFQLYSATKACLTNFFKSLRVELKGKVNVSTVLPGGVYTRPDVCKDIAGQGLWGKLSAKKPEYVVKTAAKAVKKNKKIVIPGFWNKFLYHVMKIVPEGIRLNFIANRWKKQTKDAF